MTKWRRFERARTSMAPENTAPVGAFDKDRNEEKSKDRSVDIGHEEGFGICVV